MANFTNFCINSSLSKIINKLDQKDISAYPIKLIFCFLQNIPSTVCSKTTFTWEYSLENIKTDLAHLDEQSIDNLSTVIENSEIASERCYKWINQENKRQAYFLKNCIPIIVKKQNPLNFKKIENISIEKYININAFENLRIQMELNFPYGAIENIFAAAHDHWINTKKFDKTIDAWLTRERKNISKKIKAAWNYIKDNEINNDVNIEPHNFEELMIYFDALFTNIDKKNYALTKIKYTYYANNRKNKKDYNQEKNRQAKQLTGYVPEIIREILNKIADQEEKYQGELITEWTISQLYSPQYKNILEKYKNRLHEINECTLPTRVKKPGIVMYTPWIENIGKEQTNNSIETTRAMNFSSRENTPAMYAKASPASKQKAIHTATETKSIQDNEDNKLEAPHEENTSIQEKLKRAFQFSVESVQESPPTDD